MDHLSPQQRSKNMAAIHSKNTKPEMIVRRGLWKRGFRYRLNHKRLPGHPDLVLRKYRTCIFINGCFWHGHLVDSKTMESSACCKLPNTNHDFWVTKIRRNKERDKEEQRKLAVMGGYADFFADMEALVPDLLAKIDTTKEGEARYHNYTQLLGREASAWYMDGKKLPPLNEITVWKNRFSGDKNRFAANAKIIIDVYKRLKTI